MHNDVGLTEPKKLYLASNIGDLNEQVDLGSNLKKISIKLLIKSADKLYSNAETFYIEKDEEKAYIYCMRYMSLMSIITNKADYKQDKKYYDKILNPKTARKVIERAGLLQDNLTERYQHAHRLKSRIEDVIDIPTTFETKISEKNDPKHVKNIEEPKVNTRFFTCRQLHSLIKERSSSFLIVDVRPDDQFQESYLKSSHLIHIPENTLLQGGLTANKVGKDLEPTSLLMWNQRHLMDNLIICDEETDSKFEIPLPISKLIDAIESWDPGKSYKAKPVVLDGGFYMFRLMYPVMATNPNFKPQKVSVGPVITNSVLTLEYPDLNEGFCSTPSPKNSEDGLGLSDDFSKLYITPNVNRDLKPRKPSPLVHDDNFSNLIESETTAPDVLNNGMIASRVSTFSDTSKASRNSNRNLEPISNGSSLVEAKQEVDSVELPVMPERSLKPKELIASFKAKEKDIEETEAILSKTTMNEKSALEKLEKIEESYKARESTSDETERRHLENKEKLLKKDIQSLIDQNQELESKYSKMAMENKSLWNLMTEVLANQKKQLSLNKQEANSAIMKEEKEQLKAAKAKESSMNKMEKDLEVMKKRRLEKLNAIARMEENEKRRLEDLSERNSRNREKFIQDERKSSAHKSRMGGDSYTERLKTSPRSSPVRGSGKLKRSHSALNLSLLLDEDDAKVTPLVDRKLKPLEAPKKRNFNAARQRNFEPKYGTVANNRTGLKNLGNTCYMNSIMQCLNNTIDFAQYFLSGAYSDHINTKSLQRGDVAEEVAAVVGALWSGSYRSIGLWDLKTVVGRAHRPFHGCDQHDSHEFLLKLMDWLHNDLNRVTEKVIKMSEQNHANVSDAVAAKNVMCLLEERDRSAVRNLFYGLHRSVIVCDTCDNRSLTFEPFSVLTLSFPTSGRCSLKDMLFEYYKETQIDYKCSRCKRMRNCTRKLDIWKLPPVLVIHLNRFEHDVLTRKKQNFVEFPIENFNMSSYTASINAFMNYDLYGVSNHYGTIDGGHYTAFCRSPKSNSWAKFDDHEVYDLSREAVKTSAAYILFYDVNRHN